MAAIQATKVWTQYFTRPSEAHGEGDGTGGGKLAVATSKSSRQPITPAVSVAAATPSSTPGVIECTLCNFQPRASKDEGKLSQLKEHFNTEFHRLATILANQAVVLKRLKALGVVDPFLPDILQRNNSAVEQEVLAEVLHQQTQDLAALECVGDTSGRGDYDGFRTMCYARPFHSGHSFQFQNAAAGYKAAQAAKAVVETVAWGGTVSETAKKPSSLKRLNGIFEAAVTGELAKKTYATMSTDTPFNDCILYAYDNAEWTGRAQLSDVANRPGRHFRITLVNDHFLYLPPQLVGMAGVPGAAVDQHNIQGGFWYNPKMIHVQQHLPSVSAFVKSFFHGTPVRMNFKLSVNVQRLDLEFRVQHFRLTIQFEPGVGQPMFEEELGVF